MDKDTAQTLTGSSIGDGIVGFIAANIALVAFWWVGFGISLVLAPLFNLDRAGAQGISGLFIAPVLSWILAMLLVRPIKRKYRTLGRSYQVTLIIAGVLTFGGLALCLTLLSTTKWH